MRIQGLISIEGNIASGKTSLMNILSESVMCNSIYEEIPDISLLNKFYSKEVVDNLQIELLFFNKRYELLKTKYRKYELNISDFSFFRSLIIAKLNLSDDQYSFLERKFHELQNKIIQPNLIVYIRSNVENLKSNVIKRGRNFEKNIDIEYLEKVNNQYNIFFENFNLTNLLIINTNGNDFVNNKINKDLITNSIIDLYNKCLAKKSYTIEEITLY